MKTTYLPVILALAILPALSLRAANDIKTVVITANDTLKFNVTQIEARPGEKIHIELRNQGTLPKDVMGHNWILLKAGSDPMAYAATAISAKNEGYQPQALADRVLVSIPLIGSRQTGEITFDAPTAPGDYPYLCSFPAHCQIGMRGDLIVR